MKTLSFEQMEQINAGGWLADAWGAVCKFCVDAWDWIVYYVSGDFIYDFWDEIIGWPCPE